MLCQHTSSSDNSFLSVRQEPTPEALEGVPLPTTGEKLKSTQLDKERKKKNGMRRLLGSTVKYQSIYETVKKPKETHATFAATPQIASDSHSAR